MGASIAAMRRSARRIRRPQHSAYLHFVPWHVTPFLAAPVLPGETMKNFLMQARVLTTPVTNQLVGWWVEYYFFYVKHRHLASKDHWVAMMLDLGYTHAQLTQAGDIAPYQVKAGDSVLVRDAYTAVINEFFRGDGESVSAGNSTFKARLRLPGWWDSVIPENLLADGLGGIGDDTIGTPALDTVGEVAKAIETFNTLRMMGLTNLEYDDWLRSFGVNIAAPLDDRPELIRYTRNWQYPASAVSVDSVAQRVSTVLNWSITERADKDRYFKEPGIILGCVLARPKMYHDRAQAGVGQLLDARAWMTPLAGAGISQQYVPVQGLSGYAFDVADLYNHGDQWRYAARGTAVPATVFPADGAMDYASDAEINALFTDGATGHVKMDAVVNFSIATTGVARDETSRTI